MEYPVLYLKAPYFLLHYNLFAMSFFEKSGIEIAFVEVPFFFPSSLVTKGNLDLLFIFCCAKCHGWDAKVVEMTTWWKPTFQQVSKCSIWIQRVSGLVVHTFHSTCYLSSLPPTLCAVNLGIRTMISGFQTSHTKTRMAHWLSLSTKEAGLLVIVAFYQNFM